MREKRDKIRVGLLKNNLTQVWLINRLSQRGVDVDKSTMSSILAGTSKGYKSQFVIDESIKILDDYEIKMNSTDDKK